MISSSHIAVHVPESGNLSLLIPPPPEFQEAPLHESIRLGHLSSAQLLLRGGASANLAAARGVTPLMMAASDQGKIELVETLLDYEADPTAKDAKGWDAIRSETGNEDGFKRAWLSSQKTKICLLKTFLSAVFTL